ncbi:Wound-responsive family protein [Melia azedarach]|uniref:Wound-responsive family protein n=1 Tax=Melia azedarach TaxID=155640 RepID=A0ACC1Z1J0_MELAZ|nr:Wound-responsive family protein [Melia azedarach]
MIRNMSREIFQGMRDQAPKSDPAIKSITDSSCGTTCSSKQVKRFSGASNPRNCNTVTKGDEDKKLKQAEESLRTVMYLSCWGPN